MTEPTDPSLLASILTAPPRPLTPTSGATAAIHRGGRPVCRMVSSAREAWERAQGNAWLKWQGKIMGRITAAANAGDTTCKITFVSIKLKAYDDSARKLIVSQLTALGFKVEIEQAEEQRNGQGRVVAGNSIVIDFSIVQ